jgi:transcriptional regulator with XRE-family HTH domain
MAINTVNFSQGNVKLIQSVLNRLNMNQRDLAAKIGVSEAYISIWMNGKREIPKHYKTSLEQLLGQNHDKKLVAAEPSKITSDVSVPILPDIPDSNEKESIDVSKAIGNLTFPVWMLGGSSKDCYIVRMPSEYIVLKRKKVYTKGDYVVIKIDGAYDMKRLENLSANYELEVKGVVVMSLKNI